VASDYQSQSFIRVMSVYIGVLADYTPYLRAVAVNFHTDYMPTHYVYCRPTNFYINQSINQS